MLRLAKIEFTAMRHIARQKHSYFKNSPNKSIKNPHRTRRQPRLLQQPIWSRFYVPPRHTHGILIARFIYGSLNLRNIALGGGIYGYICIKRKYEEWRDSLPDFNWIYYLLPTRENCQLYSKKLQDAASMVKNAVQMDSFMVIRQWTEQGLSVKTVVAGSEGLLKKFLGLMEKSKTLASYLVHDKTEWDAAIKFLEESVNAKLTQTEETLNNMLGPGYFKRLTNWSYLSEDQSKRRHVQTELNKILKNDDKHTPTLSYDELTTVRKHLQRENVEVDTDYIRQTWFPIYRKHFLKMALQRAKECRKAYFLYSTQGTECVINWNIPQIMKAKTNALRQYQIYREALHLNMEIENLAEDDEKLQLLVNQLVSLAEKSVNLNT